MGGRMGVKGRGKAEINKENENKRNEGTRMK
jgi:hypothetical protein